MFPLGDQFLVIVQEFLDTSMIGLLLADHGFGHHAEHLVDAPGVFVLACYTAVVVGFRPLRGQIELDVGQFESFGHVQVGKISLGQFFFEIFEFLA